MSVVRAAGLQKIHTPKDLTAPIPLNINAFLSALRKETIPVTRHKLSANSLLHTGRHPPRIPPKSPLLPKTLIHASTYPKYWQV